MHRITEQWDREHGFVPRKLKNGKSAKPPARRPCDWCGKPIDRKKYPRHYIHPECCDKERDFWYDIFY